MPIYRSRYSSHTKNILSSALVVVLAFTFFLRPLALADPSNFSKTTAATEIKKSESNTSTGNISAKTVNTANKRYVFTPTDCSSQSALRREISNRWRFFTQPIPPFLPGIGIPGINKKSRKAYEELYWSARSLEEIGKQLLREARREVDSNLLSAACSIVDKELRVQSLITTTDADANNLWYGFLNDTYDSVKRIRDLCINILEVGGVVVSGGIPLLVLGILNSLLKEMTDNALFQAKLSPETYGRILIFDIVIPILLEIKIAKWGNKTFSEYVTKKITLPTLVKNPPGFVKLIKEAFRFFIGELKPALSRKITARLAGIITNAQITALVDGVNYRLEQYSKEPTTSNKSGASSVKNMANIVVDDSSLTMLEITPVETATEVNITASTVLVRFSEPIQAVNIQGQLFHQDGSVVPSNGGVVGDTLFFNLGSTLQANTSYTMHVRAGSVKSTESGAVNEELEWSFVTDTTSFTNGSLALVTNTGGVGLRLRNSPSINAGIITTLLDGTSLTVTGNSAQANGYTWYPVQTKNGQSGWAATGIWLTAVDQYGFRPGGEVRVSNTNGAGLQIRVDPGEASPVISLLSEGTVVTLTGDPVFAGGYSWFPVQTSDGSKGYCAVAHWLIPYNQSGASNLIIRTVGSSAASKLDWGQSITYDFYVTDGNGLPVSGAVVSGQNNLIGNIFTVPNVTDANGKTSYTTTVSSGQANGGYLIVASASRNGFSNSLSVTRRVEVSHGCSYEVHATENTFSSSGGGGSLTIITQPGCGWSVPQYPGFVNLTSADHGIGDGEVTFNVAANSSISGRTGNITVAGAFIPVNQEGAPVNAQTSIGTDPDGLTFTVDGQTYTSRQSFAWANGSTHTISASSPQTISANQFKFTGWSDSGAQTHNVTANTNQTLTALFDLPASTNVALDYSWQTRSISIVHGWGAASVAPGDGFLYVLGGSVNSARFSRFDPVSNTWTQLPALPSVGTLEGSAAMLAGKIYVYGNYSSTIMQVYDLASGQWLNNRTGPYPFPVRGLSFVVIGDDLYAVGGSNINLDPVPGLKKYNPSSDTWTQLADMPTPRASGATVLVDGRIYVAGGNASGNGIASVNIYDPQSNTWAIGTPLPQTRILATAIAINSRILVLGGSNGTVETRSVLEYNPISDVWRELTQFNQARYGAVGAFIRGKLYIIGGEEAANHTAFATLEEGTPSSWAPVLSFGQVFGASSGNRTGVVDLLISNPSNSDTPLTLLSSDPSKISFPFTYHLSPGQTSTQIVFNTGHAGGPVTIIAELPNNLARVRAYKQITVTPGTAAAETQTATDITSQSASLNGKVNPAGSPTSAFFEWGTDSNLNNPQATIPVNAGDGLTPVAATYSLGNLQPGTTYYYRAAATNDAGTTRSTIQSFATPAATSTLSLDSISPKMGRDSGGQQIRLFGSFAGLSTVKIGGISTQWSYSNGTSEITVTTPAHDVGAFTIDLVPSSGSTITRLNAFAFLPTVFTDNTLIAKVTEAKAQHIFELRQAIDALRAVAGLPAAVWTDPKLAFGAQINATHIQELRSYLEAAAASLGFSAVQYTDSSLEKGYIIQRTHIEELRQRIRTIAGN